MAVGYPQKGRIQYIPDNEESNLTAFIFLSRKLGDDEGLSYSL